MLNGAADSPVDMVGDEPTFRHEHVISDSVRAMVDKMCYLAVFGSKSVFEAKVPAAIRAQFAQFITDLHRGDDNRKKFADAWKAYVRANPPGRGDPKNGSIDQEMISAFGLADVDDPPPAAAAAAADGSEPVATPV